MKKSYTVNEKELLDFCHLCLVKYGMEKDNALIMAQHLIETDKWGIFTHGTKNLLGYIKKNLAGGVSFKSKPSFIKEFLSLALLDSNNMTGFISGTIAMEKACDMAEKTGVGMVVVVNSCHYGAGACYANIAAKRGFIGFCASNVDKKMTIPGSKGTVIGHNPFTIAAPATIIPSVFLDSSSSNTSALKVLRAKQDKESIPYGWICDKDGNPTNDPSKFPEEGGLIPMGNHKGYGIAFFIDVLTGLLGSSLNSISDNIPSWCFDLDKPNKVSHTFIAINSKMLNVYFENDIDKLINDVHELPKSNKDQQIYVPGEIEWNNYYKNNNGTIFLPEDVVCELIKLSDFSGISLKVEEQ